VPAPSRVWWDLQHRMGWWTRRLASDTERLRYQTLGAAICSTGGSGSLLDLGCGHGLLADHLGEGLLRLYTGVDFSSAAIAAGRQTHEPAGARFIAADLRYWTPPEKVDTMVFNEVLYYFARPPSLIRRYSGWLSPGGCVFVSMYHAAFLRAPLSRLRIDSIWRTLGREFDLLDTFTVRDAKGAQVFRIAQLGARPT
jgi:2-polyprenyl-3-methyl-5-hydroxy-6-metoxy-1,4-benzoquinol methylase